MTIRLTRLATLGMLLWAGACGHDAHTAPTEPKAQPPKAARPSDARPTPRSSGPSSVLPVPPGGVEIESQFSKIVIEERGTVRTLLFVRDTGQRVVESQMDVARPHELLVRYTRSMFASYLLVPKQKRVLIIGIGAGSMIRFLQHFDPELSIEAVDIDPMIVEVAASYFGTRENDHVQLIAADGLVYLNDTPRKYDVIYMDAFLKPSMSTDSTGVPLRMKTIDFYKRMQDKLTEDGAVVFNLNWHRDVQKDIDTIAEAFASTHLFKVPRSGNYVLVATRRNTDFGEDFMRNNAKAARAVFGNQFSVAPFIEDLDPDGKVP